MPTPDVFPIEGGCACAHIRCTMASAPLFVHRCHCCWCRRETGACFALNAMIEADRMRSLGAEPDRLPPGVHIFTRSKQLWVEISAAAPSFGIFYECEKLRPAQALARQPALRPQIEAWQASLQAGSG